MSEPTRTEIFNAVRNEHPDKSFTLGDRAFPVKDLSYDDYIEFCELARPIIESVIGVIAVDMASGGMPDVSLNPAGLDFNKLLKLAGSELPRMAWLCARQSDPSITVADVKRLGRRPMTLLKVVLLQIKHNQLVQEFVDFFQSVAQDVSDLVPDLKEAMSSKKPSELTITEIR